MRQEILIFSDTHNTLHTIEDVLTSFDRAICLGDIGDSERTEQVTGEALQRTDSYVLARWLNTGGKQFVYLRGNHSDEKSAFSMAMQKHGFKTHDKYCPGDEPVLYEGELYATHLRKNIGLDFTRFLESDRSGPFIGLYGDTHVRMVTSSCRDGGLRVLSKNDVPEQLGLKENAAYFINPGTDSYIVFDPKSNVMKFKEY